MEPGAQGDGSRTLEHGGNDHVRPVGLHLPANIRVGDTGCALDGVINNDQRRALRRNRPFKACAGNCESILPNIHLRKIPINRPEFVRRTHLG